MELPKVVHPKTFIVNGLKYQVVAYCSMTDEQALKVLIYWLKTHIHKPKKFAANKVFQVVTTFDKDSLAIL